ncbi:hypothetical protein [Streptomyces mirabilis]|uniref:hypothetical protein n=1 Tax=Streptomyces mirabilis TaxID=68239 RepID=UPI0036ED3F9E
MTRAYDLVRRKEALNFLQAQHERAALTPAAVHQPLAAPAPAPALPPAQPAAPQRAVPAFA